jgi:hypothetical protein
VLGSRGEEKDSNMALDIITGSFVIPSGQSLSQAVPIPEVQLLTLYVPGTWTTANITYRVVLGGVTYEVSDETTFLSAAGPVSGSPRAITLSGFLIPAGAEKLQIRSGTLTLPVNQAAERTIPYAIRRFG